MSNEKQMLLAKFFADKRKMNDKDIDLLCLLDDIYIDKYNETRDRLSACLAVIEYIVLVKSEQLVCDHNWKQWE